MKTTVRRTTIVLTKEDCRMMDILKEELQDTQTQIFKRGLQVLYERLVKEKSAKGE